jgi:hypothetical protein
MKVHCPCGEWLKDDTDMRARFADLLPHTSEDDYCETVAAAVQEHSDDPEIAAQYVIAETTRFFRCCCQCVSCGRLFVEDAQFQIHEFLPATDLIPRNLLAAHTSQKNTSAKNAKNA